jgi:beta-phosphoglucomutase
MEYDAVLFDFDGVLVDSEPVHYSCWLDMLAPFGLTLDKETFDREFLGETDRFLVNALSARRNPPIDPELVWAEYPKKRELFRRRMTELLPFAPGILELLTALAPRLPLGLVTSSRDSEVIPVLEAGGIARLFRVAVFGNSVSRHKPDPEPYLKARNTFGALRPLAVEDSPPGIASARAAGCEVVEVPSTSEVTRLVRERLGML